MARYLIGNLKPPLAKVGKEGIVKPDGKTILIDDTGTLRANLYNGFDQEIPGEKAADAVTVKKLKDDISYGVEVQDCNLAIEPNITYIVKASGEAAHKPTTDDTWYTIKNFVFTHDYNFSQIAFNVTTGRMFIRNKAENIWTDWDGVVTRKRMQGGRTSIERKVGETTSVQVTFPKAFSSVPAVTVAAETGSVESGIMTIRDVSATGFTAYTYSKDANSPMGFCWMATEI